jgi:hypothetical protein
VNLVCDTISGNITAMEMDPAVNTIFTGILEAIRGVSSVQSKIVLNWQQANTGNNGNTGNTDQNVNTYTSLGAISKRARPEISSQATGSGSQPVSEPIAISIPLPAIPVRQPDPVPESAQDKKN